MSCYILSGITMLFSFLFIAWSKNHALTTTITLIYLLEVLTQSCSVSLFKLTPANSSVRVIDSLTAIAFSAHWMGLGIFTGGYIKVATQIPLLRSNQKFQWLPSMLNLVIAGILTVLIYIAIFVQNANTKLKWGFFFAKFILALVILIV
jgi:hypothetical protein